MNNFELEFHHLGLAVTKPEQAIVFLKNLHYDIQHEVYDPLQKVNLRIATHASMPDVELIYRKDETSPIDHILQSRTELIYHICYITRNLENSLNKMKECNTRYICVSPPKPAILFGGKHVSFYLVRGFGLIEILETNS